MARQRFSQAILMSVIRHKNSILQLSFETQSSYIYFYLFACFGFCLNTKLPEFICSKFLAIKIKSYLHVLYMQLFDYLCIRTYITYLDIEDTSA